MTAKEAYKKLYRSISGVRISKCYEYDTVFVFALQPPAVNNSSRMINGLVSVDKKTGVIRAFNPLGLPLEEYQRGKEVDYNG